MTQLIMLISSLLVFILGVQMIRVFGRKKDMANAWELIEAEKDSFTNRKQKD